MNPEGYLDGFTNRRIAGWVRDRDAPGRRVQLEARLGNTRLADLVADGFREDLRAAGIGDGRHAFALDLPRPLSDVECALLNLRIPGSSRLFLAGELHLLRQDLPPPPAQPVGSAAASCISAPRRPARRRCSPSWTPIAPDWLGPASSSRVA
ncbi:MAG: hypothetical protein NT133_06845 [Alphaproteobacteria bacterium]|nr:hypothetical protein [Alphaproteobacteria bacterium]